MPGKGVLSVVGLPIGNLADLSPRAREMLETAGLVLCEDTRTLKKLASLTGMSLKGQLLSLDKHQEQGRVEKTLAALANGLNVALVSEAGTPGVNDPGARVVKAARAAGFTVAAVPGPSVLAAALSLSGFEGPVLYAGYAPRTGGGLKELLEETPAGAGLLALESPHRLRQTLGLLGERSAILFHELTKVHEEVLEGPASALLGRLDAAPKGEWTMLILPEAPEEAPDMTEAAAWLRDLLPHMNASQAARIVAQRLGLPKNQVYKLAVEMT